MEQAITQILADRFPLLKIREQAREFLSDNYSELGDLSEVVPLGDLHENGQVSLFIFANSERLILKPRPCIGERLLYSVEKTIFTHIGLEDFNPRVLKTTESMSVIEYCEAQDPHTILTDEFLFRAGVKGAILYCLGATDIGYENVVIRANTPVIIDSETLFSPEAINYQAKSATWNYSPYYLSVSRIGIFPSNHIFSLLYNRRQLDLLAKNVDAIYSRVKGNPVVTKENACHIQRGFHEGILALDYHRTRISALLTEIESELIKLRVILRETKNYMNYFDGNETRAMFNVDELTQLDKGCIPYFTFESLGLNFEAKSPAKIFVELLYFAKSHPLFLNSNFEKLFY